MKLLDILSNDENKPTRKERVAERRDIRAKKVEDKVDKEISSLKQSAPAANTTKSSDWNKDGGKPIIEDKYVSKVDELSNLYKPQLEQLPELDKNKLVDLERKSKRRKILDIGLGAVIGMGGNSVDPDKLPGGRLRAEKEKIYKDYKDISDRNKKTLDAFNQKEYDTKRSLLLSAYNKAQTPEEKQLLEDKIKREDERFNTEMTYKNRALDENNKTARARIAASKNKPTKTASQSEILPLESENIINEMNLMTGGASAAKSTRNQQRLSDLLKTNPNAYESLVQLSDKSANIRAKLDKQESLRSKAKLNALPTDEFDNIIAQLESELSQYQNNIKSIINGKIPEVKTQSVPETKTETQAKPDTKKAIDDFFK